MTYATRQDVRDFGVTTGDAVDARVDRALARADSAIDNYCGRTFVAAASRTEVVDGIYRGTVPLPPPFSSVTAVTIDGIALSQDQYEVRDFGLQLFAIRLRDGDGFPLTWSGIRAYPRIAATVKVTATFGYSSVPATVVEAAVMLASAYARLHADDSLAPSVVRHTNAGGTYLAQGATRGISTGYLEVDAMLDEFVYAGWMVD